MQAKLSKLICYRTNGLKSTCFNWFLFSFPFLFELGSSSLGKEEAKVRWD